MSTFTYHDYLHDETSSVVREAYYNREDGGLVVSLHNGTVCGYRNVDLPTWQAFEDAESRGRFWNQRIKHHFVGESTEHIDSYVDEGWPAKSAVEDVADDLPFVNYAVKVELSGTITQSVEAIDVETAIREVRDQFAALGVTARVVSVNERN